ncbi:MAG TPA: F0F1 ATP synthase subunit B [Burkholderiales bacterium]|nr:F0F1 ATP synthase subunit B [Burkholderiales bacterium]
MSINLTLFAQAAVFLSFIWFTKKLVWPYLLRAIEARQKTIAEGLAAAERGRLDLEAAAKRSNEMMADARKQMQDIIAQADRRAAQIVEEAKQNAKSEGDRMIAGAKAEIDQEFSRARETLREQVAALAVAGAEKILRREVDAKAHADLLSQLKQELR